MTVTKCSECPFFNPVYYANCWYGYYADKHHVLHLKEHEVIDPRCPIASGKPFEITFTPLNENKNK